MKTLLSPGDRNEILDRLAKVHPDSQPCWGTMSAHQMVCHLSDSFRASLNEKYVSPSITFLKRTLYFGERVRASRDAWSDVEDRAHASRLPPHGPSSAAVWCLAQTVKAGDGPVRPLAMRSSTLLCSREHVRRRNMAPIGAGPLATRVAEALAFGCPRKMGQKKRHFHVLLIC
jgi:hypothetical protein